VVDSSFLGGDATCLRCGHLLWWFRDRLNRISGLAPDEIGLDSSFLGELGVDSLEVIELPMEIEEGFGATISEEQARRIRTDRRCDPLHPRPSRGGRMIHPRFRRVRSCEPSFPS
jgi:acyl carrier protein